MTSTSNWNNTTSGLVVAYFSSGVDAQNAINELVDEGFPVDEIGAVFHSRAGAAAGSEAGAPLAPGRPHHEEMTPVGATASAAGTSGAKSDTSGVTPAGLATGAGTGFTGASRPGPIPGSEIPESLYSKSPSAISPSEPPPSASEPTKRDLDNSYGVLSASPSTSYELTQESAGPHSEESWWDKLKHLFSTGASGKREPQSEKGAANFGTGEGQLGVVEYRSVEYDYPYSGSAFESSFGSMGLPESHARRLSNAIRRGGAIVTVNAESRRGEAERVLERNHGQIREELDGFSQPQAFDPGSEGSRVRVFGCVQRVYPSYISSAPGYISSDQPARKVS